MSFSTRVRFHPVRWGLGLLALVVAGFFLTPRVSQALDDVQQLHGAAIGWLIVSCTGEIASLLCFSLVTYVLIQPARRPSFGRILRVDMVTVALSHAVPAGSVAGTALGYELLAEEGVGEVESGFVKVSQSLLSGMLLQAMLGGFLLLKVMLYGPTTSNWLLAAAGGLIVGFVIGFVVLLERRPAVVRRVAVRLFSWLPSLTPERLGRFVDELAARLSELLRQPGRLGWAVAGSLGNWVFDLLSLWAALRAFGDSPNIALVGVAFCIAQVAAALPISPAGLGVVESSLVPLLISFGASSVVAVLGVLTWRVFNFWFPLPVGALAYVSILISRRQRPSMQTSQA
ncbi:MAG: YbhN family protein [Jatrophihabitantaceae bacterium]